MKRAAIYARVSTSGQAEQGTSLQSQTAACRAYAEAHGYTVIREVQEDVSGTTLDRPGLDTVRALASAGAVEAVIVHEQDRLSRSLPHTYLLLDEFERVGVALLFVLEPDATTPEGRMMFGMRGLFKEYERAIIVERMRRGRDQRVRMGRIIRGRTPPYGYAYDTDNHTLAVDEATAPWVRRMFTWYTTEEISLYEVARRLNLQGAPMPEGGRGWRASNVRATLQNEVYMGEWVWGKWRHHKRPSRKELRPRSEWLIVPVPALVTPETWAYAQHRRATNNSIGMRATHGEYLLKSIVFCGICGRRMISLGLGYRAGNAYYECYDRHRERETQRTDNPVDIRRGCNVMIRADALEAALWAEVVRQFRHPAIEAAAMPTQPPALTTPATDTPQNALRAIQRQRDRLLDTYLTTDTLTKQDFEKRAAALQKKADALQHEIDTQAHQVVRIAPEHMQEYIREHRDRLPLMPFREKRQMLVDIGITVHVTRDPHTYTLMHAEVRGLPFPVTLHIPKPRRKDYKGAS